MLNLKEGIFLKKISILIILSLVICFGCSPKAQVFEDFSKVNIVWDDYEKATYDLYVDGVKTAGYEVLIEQNIDDDTLVYKVETTTTSKDGVGVQGAVVNRFMEPKNSYYKQTIRGGNITRSAEIYGVYEHGNLSIDRIIGEKYESQSVELPENSIDNEYSLMLARNLPLTKGYSTSLNIAVIATAQVAPYKISVEGIEKIKVPYGEVECYKVVWKYRGIGRVPNIYAWYSTGSDKKMIKYVNQNLELMLTEFSTSKN